MKKLLIPFAALALSLPLVSSPLTAQGKPQAAPSPSEIINAAGQEDWQTIAPEDLLVMTLAPDSKGNERKVIIQLMPKPFSQGWVENIRTLARGKWYDGISVNRVQDNYVVQWGDPGHDNPEGEGIENKPLPEGLKLMDEADYTARLSASQASIVVDNLTRRQKVLRNTFTDPNALRNRDIGGTLYQSDPYSAMTMPFMGWPMAMALDVSGEGEQLYSAWPVHCYGMVGVGRNYSPDTGSGAELYTVIGHAPRHLDRNIALAGRIISGMEHLSSLPRGSGVLGFYTEEEADKRTPILSIRVASDLPENERPQFEYLSTETEAFARYAEARANRRDPFFIVPAGGADICNIPVPVRRFEYTDDAAAKASQ